MHGPNDTIYQFPIYIRATLFNGKKVCLHSVQMPTALSQIPLSQLVVKIDHSSFSSKPFSSLGLYPSGQLQSTLKPLEFLDCAGQKLAAVGQLPSDPGPFH